MSWPEVVLAALNVFQAVALAYISVRAREVAADTRAHNGDQAAAIRELRHELARRRPLSGRDGP